MRFFVRRTPKTPNIMLQNIGDGATPTRASHKQPPRRSRIRSCFESLLPKLRLPVAVLTGAIITAFTTFALVRHVQHEIANAKVSSDPRKWMQIARTEAYDACYYGCNDCRHTDWAYNACKMTARANVTGVICDGNLMWNWAARYPTECLEAVGELYKAEALRKLKQTYRNQLALIILTVLAGIIGAVITCKIWSCTAARCQARPRSRPSSGPSTYQAADNEPSPPPKFPPRMRGGAGRSAGRITLITTAFASIVSRSRAYPCTGHGPIADQYFINANKTLYGVVHGWLSDCYDYTCGCTTFCWGMGGDSWGMGGDSWGMGGDSWGMDCDSWGMDGDSWGMGGDSCGRSCSTTCRTCTASNAAPIEYVNAILGHVKACGFELMDVVDGDVNMRVANPLIEKKWWVKISVNKFNLTDVTDPSIFCLHDFANN